MTTTSYEPVSTWTGGVERANPSYRQAWVDEVFRLLEQAGRDRVQAEDDLGGPVDDFYNEWYKDPAGFLAWLYPPQPADPSKPEPVKTLWRLKPIERRAAVRPFIGHQVRLERWYGRVAANGDITYTGKILAVAITTIGTAADIAILETDEGTCWAISLAQVAHLEVLA